MNSNGLIPNLLNDLNLISAKLPFPFIPVVVPSLVFANFIVPLVLLITGQAFF